MIKEYIDEMAVKGFIRFNNSPYTAPILVVKKLIKRLRVCIDYRALNALTIKNRNIFLLIREILSRLCKVKYYSKFDVIAAFNKIRIKKGDEEKTAFLIRYGLFKYLIMLFGLCNVPGIFQSYINETLHEYLDKFCSAYLDDILIYNDTEEEHLEYIKIILKKLRKAGLYLDIKKCEFKVKIVKYLGLIIIDEGIKINPAKVETIQNWKILRYVKDI